MHESDCGPDGVMMKIHNIRGHEPANYADELDDASDDYNTNRDY